MSIMSLGRQTYINLRTFRKSGEAVETPLWVVPDGDTLYLYTQAASGKVKRIRNNGKVEVAASDVRGKVKGEWLAAAATIDETPETMQKVIGLLLKKYGFQFKITMWWLGEKAYKRRAIVVLRDSR
jgi:PPOX class probable F420-dependent enzyme